MKHSGQVFTPDFLVDTMLDFCGYTSSGILRKHVIDNSCGDGAFLSAVVSRYCEEYLSHGFDKEALKIELQTYIHGIELDNIAYENCLYNLDELAKNYGLCDVKWDIRRGNALAIRDFDGAMDFVVGNPPYVRVHNLDDSYEQVKSFHFANGGMTDLYLVFFELGFRMLKDDGRLCYITPSSWLNSLAATNMRDYISRTERLAGIIDLEHYQAFDGATTYTMISLFDNSRSRNTFEYYVYDEARRDKRFIGTLSYRDIAIGKDFYVSAPEDLKRLRRIKQSLVPRHCVVKNGFATLADKVFIGDIPFDEYTIPVLKASTGRWYLGFFPYDKQGKPIPKDVLFANPSIENYFNAHKEELLKGEADSKKTDWYLYGRTQALKDVYEDKIAVNTLIKGVDSIKLNRVPAGSGLYSGLYILTKAPFAVIESLLKSNEFVSYIKTLKNYKSGGYYTFNSKDLEQYLNYKLSHDEQARSFIPIDGRGVSGGYLQLF
jgi:adenine-specific DNA-methyltransferase